MSGIWGFLFEVLILGLLGVLAVVLGFFLGVEFFFGGGFFGVFVFEMVLGCVAWVFLV